MSGRMLMSTNGDFLLLRIVEVPHFGFANEDLPTKKPQSHAMTAVSGGCGSFPRVSRQSYRGSAAGTFFQWPGGNSNGISPTDASGEDDEGVANGNTLELNFGIFALEVDRG